MAEKTREELEAILIRAIQKAAKIIEAGEKLPCTIDELAADPEDRKMLEAINRTQIIGPATPLDIACVIAEKMAQQAMHQALQDTTLFRDPIWIMERHDLALEMIRSMAVNFAKERLSNQPGSQPCERVILVMDGGRAVIMALYSLI